MKRGIIAALLMCIAPCLLKAQGKFLLKGKLGAVKDGAKIYLKYEASGKRKKDSAILQDGQFSFAGSLTGPDPVTAELSNATPRSVDYVQIFLENGTIYVNSPDSLKNAVITGSTTNDDKNRLEAALQPVNNKINRCLSEMDGNTDTSAEKKNELDKRAGALVEERQMIYRKFISENPESYISFINIPMANGLNIDYDKWTLLFNKFSKKMRNSALGKNLSKTIESSKSTRIGAIAPDFTLNDTSGVPVKLSSFQGRYVLLDFWASWCKPCRAENPLVVKSFNKYKEKNFTVLSVSFDITRDKDKWLNAIHDDHLSWTNVFCGSISTDNNMMKLYSIRVLPMNYLIDPSGKIIAKDLHREALDEKLSEVLK